ncbi:SPRY domain-containing protein [Paenibacillus sp. NPDC058174]|uniref:SPRY domain-containing protein n=1 Tax=Paenibacillus sp. NPDC058174 TaxID=3346366 RepID=UPI0036DD9835
MTLVTWDITNKGSSVLLTNNNMTAMVPNLSNTARASVGRNSGKWYWEITFNALRNVMVGIVNSAAGVEQTYNSIYHRGIYSFSGNKIIGPTGQPYGSSFGAADTIGILLNLDQGTIEFLKNNTSFGIAFSDLLTLGTVYPSITAASGSGGGTVNANFGATPFKYTVPLGYSPYAIDERVLIMEGKNIYSYVNKTLNYVSDAPVTKDMFSTYGVELAAINRTLTTLSFPMDKSNISTELLGSGKVFKKKIDLNKFIDIKGISIKDI